MWGSILVGDLYYGDPIINYSVDSGYDDCWYDETGRKIDGGDLEALFQADKVRKQADEVLHADSTVNTD